MSRSHLMSWVTSAVVHTSMLVVLGSALTALPVVVPEVPGNRIVVMSSMADVSSPESVRREIEPTAPVEVLEATDDVQPSHQDPQELREIEESTRPPPLSPKPLHLAMFPVSVPELLSRRQLGTSRVGETTGSHAPKRRDRERVASPINHVDLPRTSRPHPDSPQTSRVKPVEVPPVRRPAPADIQPSSASTSRQQSSNSVAQTVGTTPTKPARPISNPNPTYPPEAVQHGLEGRVLLSVTIAVSGKVTKVTVAESCGHESLDQAALDAVRRWRFSPATRGGKPFEWTARLPIRFRL
ncbi:MAG: TonB family protein [Planctomycetales bacterium]|jgi:TonB family protein